LWFLKPMVQLNELTAKLRWRANWQSHTFRKKALIGMIGLVLVFSFLPFFFQIIEKRPGVQLDDWVLNRLPARDISVVIFIFIWSAALLAFIRVYQQPDIFVLMAWSYLLLTVIRMITLSLVALNPPKNLLVLKDPLSNLFYGNIFITKDLFFSGHTSTIFMIYFCLQKKSDRIFSLIASIVVAFLLLVQHVHYTVDVLAAPFFAYGCVWMAKKIVGSNKR
jgi:hypothetical protein